MVVSPSRLAFVPVPVAITSFAFPCRVLEPSNVTSAFSLAQVKFALLKRATIVDSERGMEKFVCASAMRRVILSPTVTFKRLESVAVVQPVALAVVHVEPVKPFVQIHAQEPLSITLVPPFLHAVLALTSHCWTAETVVDFVFDEGLWNTKSSRGTTTAAAMMIRRIKRTRMKPQHGRPQQRRFFLGDSVELPLSPYCPGEGQDEVGRSGVPFLGVAIPGGGKAASMPERPDLCFSSGDKPNSLSLARSLSLGQSLSANRLPGLFPRSIIAASLVARLIKSGKLVKLPLASASRTASISSLGGLRIADNRLKPGLGVRAGAGGGANELAAL